MPADYLESQVIGVSVRRANRGSADPRTDYIPPVSLTLRFLGTSASRPTVERGVSAIAVVREGETFLFDCGEGTQRQIMRYGIAFALRDIFSRTCTSITCWAWSAWCGQWPFRGGKNRFGCGASRVVANAAARGDLGADRLDFPVEYRELQPGDTISRKGYEIVAFAADHLRAPALGYALVESLRLGRFNPERAREMGVPEGPLWGRLHWGERVALDDGREIDPSDLVGPTRPGRKLVVTGDTRPCDATVEAAAGANLLVHEATFAEEEAARAAETGHSTAREAAQVAAKAGVSQLVLTHVSARYSRDVSDLEREAREVFPGNPDRARRRRIRNRLSDAAAEPSADANRFPVRASG